MARKKTKSVRKTLRVGKTRISGQLTKSRRGRKRTASLNVRTRRKKLSVRASARTKSKRQTASIRAKAGGKAISFRVSGGKSNGNQRSRKKQEPAGFHLSQKAVERNAAQLIDLAANILKTSVQLGVAVGTEGGAKSKQFIKKQANSIVTAATRRLNDVVRKSSRLAHKGISKL
jgi:hypothetical protein